MFTLATCFPRDNYYLVDVEWDPNEYFNGHYTKRMRRHSLRMEIITMAEHNEYHIAIFKTFWISIFQRKIKKWLAVACL
jgi:NAD-specific glutamate dehydrogenase